MDSDRWLQSIDRSSEDLARDLSGECDALYEEARNIHTWHLQIQVLQDDPPS